MANNNRPIVATNSAKKYTVQFADGSYMHTDDPAEYIAGLETARAQEQARNDEQAARLRVLESSKSAGNVARVSVSSVHEKAADGTPKKGGLSFYGFTARFPITLYAAQMPRFASLMPSAAALILAQEAGEDKGISYRTDDERTAAVAWARSIVA